MTTRYIVNDVEAAIEFYTGLLGFDLKQQAGAAFAIVQRDDLALMLTGPAASAQRPMPDGSQPTPGGWNRILVEVEDIAATVAAMRSAGATFRNDIMSGKFGQTSPAIDVRSNSCRSATNTTVYSLVAICLRVAVIPAGNQSGWHADATPCSPGAR